MSVREDLILDISRAQRSIDELEKQLTGAVSGLRLSLDTSGIAPEITGAVQRANTNVTVGADTTSARREVERLGEGVSTEIPVGADTTIAERELDRFRREQIQTNRNTDLGFGDAIGVAAFLTGANRLIDASAAAEQSVGGLEVVFGSAADEVDRFNTSADKLAGLSTTLSRQLTAGLGGALKATGSDMEEAADQSVELVQRGADLAATYGGTTQQAVEAFGAALRGEFDSAEQFNVFLNQASVDARAVELGLASAGGETDRYARAQATLSLILEGSADAAGQFRRELDTASGAAAVSAAQRANEAADIGETLLPLYVRLNEVAAIGAQAFGAIPGPIQLAGIALLGFGAIARPLAAGIDLLRNASTLLTRTFDRAAIGAYNLSGNVGTVASRVGVATVELTLLAGAIALASDKADRADLSKLENSLLGIAEGSGPAGEAAEVLGEDFDRLGAAIELITKPSNLSRIENLGYSINRAIGDTDDDLSNARALIDDLDASLATLASRDPESAAAAIDAITGSLSPAEGERLVGLLDKYETALAEIDTTQRTTGGSLEELRDQIDVGTEALSKQERALQLVNESLTAYQEGFDRAFGRQDLEAATDRRTEDLSELAAGIAERAEAVVQARERLQQLREDPESTTAELVDAERELREAVEETSLTLLGNSDAALRNRDEVRNLTRDVADVISKHREEGATLGELQYIRAAEIQSLRDQLTQMGYNEAEIEVYIDAIEAVPLTRATTFTADTAPAEIQIQDFLTRTQRLLDLNPLSVDVLQSESQLARAQGRQVQARRLGGAYGPGWRLVGEEGPELDFVDYSGYIATAQQSRELLSRMDQIVMRAPQYAAATMPQFQVRPEVHAAAAGLGAGGRLHPEDLKELANLIGKAMHDNPAVMVISKDSVNKVVEQVTRRPQTRLT